MRFDVLRFGGEGEPDRKVVLSDANPDAVDPFAILDVRGAVPLLVRRSWGDDRTVATERDGDRVQLMSDARSRYVFSAVLAVRRIGKSLDALAERVVDARRMGTASTRSLYRGRRFDPASCSFEAVGWPHPFPGRDHGRQLVRVTCEDRESMNKVSLIQLVAAATGEE